MSSVIVAQVHLQYFLSSQITQNNILLHVFKNITMTFVFIYINVNLKQNRLNKNHREINMRVFNWNLKNFASLYTSNSFKRNKQKHYTETKFPWEYKYRVRLQITQSNVYALKLPSEVKMFSLKKSLSLP